MSMLYVYVNQCSCYNILQHRQSKKPAHINRHVDEQMDPTSLPAHINRHVDEQMDPKSLPAHINRHVHEQMDPRSLSCLRILH